MFKSSRRVGIDWGSESHQVCRIDGEEEPKQRSFPHTGEGLRALVDFVVEGEMEREQIAVAIEVNHGAVVEALLIKGLRVYSINPKLLDRLRDRFSLAVRGESHFSAVHESMWRVVSTWRLANGRKCRRRCGYRRASYRGVLDIRSIRG